MIMFGFLMTQLILKTFSNPGSMWQDVPVRRACAVHTLCGHSSLCVLPQGTKTFLESYCTGIEGTYNAKIELSRDLNKNNNVVSEQVRNKPSCKNIKDG